MQQRCQAAIGERWTKSHAPLTQPQDTAPRDLLFCKAAISGSRGAEETSVSC